MSNIHPFGPFQTASFTRRHVLTGCGAGIAVSAFPAGGLAERGPAGDFRVLRARRGEARLRGDDRRATPIWGYDGMVPGPLLRVRQGDEVRVRLVNDLTQPTVIHWHGLRLPNAMDGVPHLTQMPVEPGKSFEYRFVAPDAGTFWYHSHLRSSEQIGRGLYGALIVDEREPVAVDRDIVVVLDDWRLTEDGNIHQSFGSPMDASHAGRLGQYATVNGRDFPDLPVRTNERVRLRLINAANARVMVLRLDSHRATAMALDGQPAQPFELRGGRITLGPGNRADLFVDATLAPGAKAPLVLEYGRGQELPIAQLTYGGEPVRGAPLAALSPLPSNPLPERLDLANALRLEIPLDGGAMSRWMMRGGMMGPGMMMGSGDRMFWALAEKSSTGHDGAPLFRVERGRTVAIDFLNRTAFPHSMHLHGHHFRVLDRADNAVRPYWLDTVLVEPQASERTAFVADNPGKWMIHCHMIEHQESGMAAWFEVM